MSFKKEGNTMVASGNLCSVFGEDTVTVWMCQRWFAKFLFDDFIMDEERHSGCPYKGNDDILQTGLREDPHLTSTALDKKLLSCSKMIQNES